jgi:hypothetical protein
VFYLSHQNDLTLSLRETHEREITMNNATNKTLIRWYNDVTYTISELFACRSNDIIEGMGLLEIINAVLTHGTFNPICSKTGNKRFGIAITLVKRGDDASDYIKSETLGSNTVIIDDEEHLSPAIIREIDTLERKLEQAEDRLYEAKDQRSTLSIKAHIAFVERRLKEVYKKAYGAN